MTGVTAAAVSSAPSVVDQAVILAGGRGTRLWPLTARRPKALLPVVGAPFIELQLRWLARAGVEEAIVAVCVEHEEHWRAYLERRTGPVNVQLATEVEPLDTAGAVVALRSRLGERFLVLNGDAVLDVDLAEVLASTLDAPASLVLIEVEDPSAYGAVLTERGRVSSFVEKPKPGSSEALTVSAGVYLMDRRVIEQLDPGRHSFEREVFPRLVGAGELAALVVDGTWMDIGTPRGYLEAHAQVADGRFRLHEAVSNGHSGAMAPGAGAGSFAWVGAGARVADDAVLDRAVVLDDARIGPGAVVRESVVGWRSKVERGAVVADLALVGEDCVVGAGCELRHGARLGPGTELGERAVTFSAPI